MRILDILTRRMALSVSINGVYISASEIEDALSRYCKPLCAETESADFPIRLAGTAIPIIYRDNYYLICSRHQLSDIDFQDVFIFTPDQINLATPSGAKSWKLESIQNSDQFDIVALDFSDAVKEHEALKASFFHLKTAPSEIPTDHIVGYFVVGLQGERKK